MSVPGYLEECEFKILLVCPFFFSYPFIYHTKNFKILDQWKVSGTWFSTLIEIARDIFAISVTTVASESTFSTGVRVLSVTAGSLPRCWRP